MSINRSLHKIAKEGVLQTLEAKDKEIQRLNNIINELGKEKAHIEIAYEEDYKEQQQEIERLNSIIEEVREKIENTTINCEGVAEDLLDDIWSIIDKGE